jgi:hypothetical protein
VSAPSALSSTFGFRLYFDTRYWPEFINHHALAAASCARNTEMSSSRRAPPVSRPPYRVLDEELHTVALGLEATMERLQFPLLTEHVNGGAL